MGKSVSAILGRYVKHILDALPDGVFISDAAGNTIYINRTYEQLTGLKQETLQGKNVRMLVEEGIFDHVLNPEIVRTGKPATHAQTLKNGVRLALSGFPVFDATGSIRLVVTFARDVTLLSNLENRVAEQHQMIDHMTDQLAHISHESYVDTAVFRSKAMAQTITLASCYAATDATVLILGETGVGKDVLGRLIHGQSIRKDKIFLKVDCGGISEALTESELFGYVPGAFTGASNKGKPGYFEIADGGTIFLDEIGELPLTMQTRLLRVLQDNEIVRVGSSTPRKINARIIAATNRDLSKCVEEGTFRSDLYYRLNVGALKIPPLRERIEDIQPLAEHFLRQYSTKYHKILSFMDISMDMLIAYPWPGNVRELQNLIHSLVITHNGPLIAPQDLPIQFGEGGNSFYSEEILDGKQSYKDIIAKMERDFLRKAIEAHGSVQKVAKMFKINRSTIFRKLRGEKNKD